MMKNALMLIDVAYLGESDNDSLVFFDGDKHGIWPSMYDTHAPYIYYTFIARFIV
jgi:hypothetical protein